MSTSLTQAVSRFTSVLTQAFAGLAPTQSLMTAGTDRAALSFVDGRPFTELDISVDNDERDALLAPATIPYLLHRPTMVLYTLNDGNYTSAPYTGQLPLLRPSTLCYSPSTGRFYYCNHAMELLDIDLG